MKAKLASSNFLEAATFALYSIIPLCNSACSTLDCKIFNAVPDNSTPDFNNLTFVVDCKFSKL